MHADFDSLEELSMVTLNSDRLTEYLSSICGAKIEIQFVGELGKRRKSPAKKLKGFGYGIPYVVEFTVKGESKSVVLETMRPRGFGHEHFSDRAQILIWQHSAFNKLPKHVPSVDVGALHACNIKSAKHCWREPSYWRTSRILERRLQSEQQLPQRFFTRTNAHATCAIIGVDVEKQPFSSIFLEESTDFNNAHLTPFLIRSDVKTYGDVVFTFPSR